MLTYLGMQQLGSPTRRWEGYMKMHFRKLGSEYGKEMDPAQAHDQWRVFIL
jgi:hypothetical protein